MSPQPRTTSSLGCHGWKNTILQSALASAHSPLTQPSARKSAATMAVSSLFILNPNHPVPHRTSRLSGNTPDHVGTRSSHLHGSHARLLDAPCSIPPPPVSIIGAATFAHLCNQPDTQLYTVSFSPETMELSNVATHGTETDPDLSNIPSEYHEFTELFSKREAEKLPPHRPYDHEIPLVPGAKPAFGTIYSMSPTELETLRKYVEENLAKGFLRHSQSPCGAPVLLVKKSDGTLRL